ncbi:MAG: gliding motility-associated C-terminal domain-containing protein [Bacteroidetes bacterium]|nr:gliding motility-associated C-terminal domain-containing protein [Bacteroidota bacterium]
MKKINKSPRRFITLFTAVLLVVTAKAFDYDGNSVWNSAWDNEKVFTENRGQFPVIGTKDPNVLYGYDNGKTMIYFRRDGFSYELMTKSPKENDRREEFMRDENHQEEEGAAKFTHEKINIIFQDANTSSELVASEKVSWYSNYVVKDGDREHSIDEIPGFTKLTYKEIYPHIDIEFIFHSSEGIKYSIIVHPGGDISNVKMDWNGMKKMDLEASGDVHVQTMFGEIVDHAPSTFYSDDHSSAITSSFVKNEKSISFQLGDYDHSRAIVIDPWQLTSGLGYGNSNKVWECEHDNNLNSYFWGGDTPCRLKKYNNAGTIQWTYNSPWDTANFWIGTLITDNNGVSYCSGGSNGEIAKVSTAGAQVWYNNPNGFFGPIFEYWHFAFNCDQTTLVIGGMRASNPLSTSTYRGVIITINMGSGAVTGFTNVGWIAGLTIKEARSICTCPSGGYYFLTLDSIGYVNSAIVQQWKSVNGYNFSYGNPSYSIQGNMGMSAIRANGNFIYTVNGSNVAKRNTATGAVIATAAIPGGISASGFGGNTFGCSGLDLDSCGNVYVGSGTQIVKYDANLNQLATQATPGVVYDVSVSKSGQVVACGNGWMGTYAFGTCNPMQAICISAALSASSTQVNVTCNGSCNGSATAIPAGGTSPYTYSWSPSGGTAATANSLCAGNYTCTITDATSATTTVSVAITQPPAITATQSHTNISCNGGCNGTATVVASGGTGTYTYSWAPAGGTAATANSLCVGTYTCTISSPAGCTITQTFSITQPAALVATATSQNNVSCNGGSNGTASVSVSGGTSAYSYNWTPGNPPGDGTASVTGLSSGTWTCTVTDANGCTTTQTFNITQPTALTATATSTPTGCSSNTGTATASPSGGTGPYTYSWAPSGGTAATANNLAAGTYTCTITDANGCTTTANASVASSSGPALTVQSSSNVSCNGGTNGSATINATGNGPFTYSWAPVGGTAATASGLAANTYTVTVIDANGCSSTQTVSITQPTAVSGTTTTTPTGCAASTGSATVTASGGTGSYTYSWAPSGGTGSTASNLPSGNYTCTITDANGCTGTANASVSSSSGPAVTLQSSSDVSCNGGANGNATMNATGSGPFSYSWSPSGGTAATANNLTPNTYTCLVTDVNGCTTTQTVAINQPAAITSSTSTIPATCGNPDGSATVTANGGTGAYTYSWAPSGGTAATASNIPAGNYTVTITDANGCTASANASVANTGGPTVTLQSSSNVTCFGSGNGTATVNATGNSPFTYSWSPSGGTAATATSLAPGTYTCAITDASGCVTTQTVTITEPTQLVSNPASTPATCNTSNGTADAVASGGTGPYTYVWSNSQTTATLSSLAGGTYSVTVTDANGCTTTSTVVVANNGAPVVTVSSQTDESCFGDNAGSATVNATGGSSPYTYAWSPAGGTAATANGLSAGTYTVTVTGSDGCAQTQTVTITQPSAISLATSSVPENCGSGNGSATVNASGGTPGFTYSWSNSGTTATISNLAAGSYAVTVTDANGCVATQTVSVGTSGTATANAGNTITITSGQSTTLTGTGNGTTFTWSPPAGLSCTSCPVTIASPTVTTTYTLTVVDSLGCTATDTVTVFVENPCGTIWVPNAFSPNADNENDILYVRGSCVKVMDFEVFNRWGEKVFTSNDVSKGWDGKWRDKDCEAAVFTYYLRATLDDGTEIERQGSISLVK